MARDTPFHAMLCRFEKFQTGSLRSRSPTHPCPIGASCHGLFERLREIASRALDEFHRAPGALFAETNGMVGPQDRAKRIRILLGAMLGERHARRAMAEELCAEIAAASEFRSLSAEANALLSRLEEDEQDVAYDRAVESLRERFGRTTSGRTVLLH